LAPTIAERFFVVLLTAPMPVVEIIDGAVSGSLPVVRTAAYVGASQNRRKSGQVAAMPAKQIPCRQIKLLRGRWHLGDAFVAMNLEIPDENPNVDLDRSPGSHRAHGGARGAGAGTIARSTETVVRHQFRRRNELRLHQGLGMREVDERGRLVCSQSAQQQEQQTLNPALPAFPMP
jgi:hypothetical protein